ncbi:MAG TPA: DEAD/DEAH box helicase family protein [Solirubrobacterales bacterium]|nr:DEAD/DEAH box helicase family protein [Solirubrobacterales bacterium]
MNEGGARGGLPSNFLFLEAGWPKLCAEARRAEQNVYADPRTACFYSRRTLELLVRWIYDADRALKPPYSRDLSAMLFEPTFIDAVEPKIRTKMDVIRKEGNAAVHRARPVTTEEAGRVLRELFHVLYWLAHTYAVKPEFLPPASLSFDPKSIPRLPSIQQRQAKREALLKRSSEDTVRDQELEKARTQNAELQAKLARLRSETAAAKVANEARVDLHDYDEQATRDHYIDLLLKEAGWHLDDERNREFEVTGMPAPSKSGIGFVDYVLWGEDGKPLGLVEAKRTRRDPREGRQQAKLYADCLEQRFGQRPVIFYSNGYETWIWDDSRYPPRPVEGFFTRDQLELLVQRRTIRRPLGDIDIDVGIVERPYQHRAIRRVGERFGEENQRGALVVMATGAGKTRTAIALVDLMMRAGWVKRVLFLADRLALVHQTVGAFKAHLPDATTVNLVTERSAEGRVYVSTYPTMTGRIGEAEAGEEKRFGPGFFDLVIIDEAHRSVYQKYRAIFSYFDSLLLGLTATPKDDVDRNTYGLFNLEPGVPTDAYDLDEAVADGFLVPPRAISVPLKFPLNGLRYADLSEEEQEQWEEQDWGDEEMPEEVSADAVNRWLFNTDTVDKALETLMTRGHKVAGGDRLGKTIVFAKNIQHAEFIAERFDANYPEFAGEFARVVTHKTSYAQNLIDDFSTRERSPHIAVSVDMLDTGIDIPEVVNLVFFKPIRSRTKFWQMLGRGTRLCQGLFGPGEDKRDFYVFDCCDNVAFFNQEIEEASSAMTPSLGELLFRERLDLILAVRERGENDGDPSGAMELDAALVNQLRREIAGMNTANFLVRPHRGLVERFRAADPWSDLSLHSANGLAEHLANLPSADRDTDEDAKRFDLMILRLQVHQLRSERSGERLRHQVQEIAAGLLEQTAIPVIRRQQELLDDLAGDTWWESVTVAMLENARRRIRNLVKLLEKRRRTFVYTDFEDELGAVEELALLSAPVGAKYERFREKAAVYLRAHEDHLALQKLRRNVPLTTLDIEELERMLLEAGVANPGDLETVRRESPGLGTFVRSLVGLEKAAATKAFSRFIEGRNFTADQLHFLNLVIDHLTVNGIMEPSLLYEPPFTELAPLGPEGLFPEADVQLLVDTIEQVQRNSEPPDSQLAAS